MVGRPARRLGAGAPAAIDELKRIWGGNGARTVTTHYWGVSSWIFRASDAATRARLATAWIF